MSGGSAFLADISFQTMSARKTKTLASSVQAAFQRKCALGFFSALTGLSHETDLALDDMYG